MTSSIIIVDPFSTGAFYAPALKEKGYNCYGVISNPLLGDYYLSSYDDSLFENKKLLSAKEIKELLDITDVKAVIAGTESGVSVAEELGVYYQTNSNNSSSSELRRNKFLMQNALKKNGLRHILSKEITKDNLLVDDLPNNISFILKPINAASSQNVTFHLNKDSLKKGIENIDWNYRNVTGEINSKYIVQEFIEGTEYVVDLVSTGDFQNYSIASVCRYQKSTHNGSDFVYEKLEVLNPKNELLRTLLEYAFQCARALEFKYGPIHMEIMMTKDGPVLIEAAARLHGGIAPLLFKECYSKDLISMSINSYLGNLKKEDVSKIKHGVIIFIINKNKNLSIKNPKKMKNEMQLLNSFVAMRAIKLDKMPLTIDLLTCPLIVSLAGDPKTIKDDEIKIRKIFNNNMAGGKET